MGLRSNFVHEMQEAAKDAACTVAVLSPEYLASKFTASEWYVAFAQDPTAESKNLLPVRVRKCELPGFLSPMVYVDFVDEDEEVAKERLLKAIRRDRGKPTSTPAFPGSRTATPAPLTAKPEYPGLWPVPFNLPHPRNAQFTGREELLTRLHTSLTADQTTAIVQTVHGMGGVGKTQTAIEYAYRYATAYRAVWWLDAETRDVLDSGLATLAFEVGAAEIGTDQATGVAAALMWLVKHGQGWLLIYDNATTAMEIKDRIPHGGAARALITSRSPDWGSLATTLRVNVWPRKDSVIYVQTRTNHDDQVADDLATELGDLPLALAQATGFIVRTACSIPEYLELYRTQRQRLWREEAATDSHQKTVATTWNVTLRKLSHPARDMLRLCAFLAPEPIPWKMIRDGSEHVPPSLGKVLADELSLLEVRGELVGYALAEVTDRALTVHRLVQAVVRDSLKTDGQATWCAAAATLVDASFNYSDNPKEWPNLRAMMPHAASFVAFAAEPTLAIEAVCRLLTNAARFQSSQGAYVAAKAVLERAIVIQQKSYMSDNPRLAASYSDLAMVEEDLGNLAEAKRLMERAIAIQEKSYRADHPTLATSYSNLALVERRLGNLFEAKGLLERAIQIDEKSYAADHPTMATTCSNLAMVEHDLGNPAVAKGLLKRAIAIEERSYASDHPTLATSYYNLADVERDLGDPVVAKSLLERAIAIEEKAYATNHPTLAKSYGKLADVEQDLGNLTEAKSLRERADAIRQTRGWL